jgi:hypothetical protein
MTAHLSGFFVLFMKSIQPELAPRRHQSPPGTCVDGPLPPSVRRGVERAVGEEKCRFSTATSPINRLELLFPNDEVLEEYYCRMFQMLGRDNGSSAESVGRDNGLICWDSIPEDIARFRVLGELMNSRLPDEDFRLYILKPDDPGSYGRKEGNLSVEGILQASFFGKLTEIESAHLANGNKTPPLEHILKALYALKTDGLSPHYQTLARWFVLYHDLGKVVDPTSTRHGHGSAEFAQAFMIAVNLDCQAEGRPPAYTDQDIEEMVFLNQNHHLFAWMIGNLNSPTGKLYVDEKFAELINQAITTDDVREAHQEFCRQRTDCQIVKLRDLHQDFPLLRKPELLDLLYRFTVADILASDNYRHFLAVNEILDQSIRSQLASPI